MPPLACVEVHFSEALFDQNLFKVPSDVLYPLFLPISEDLHGSEQSTLLQVKQFLLAKGSHVRLLSLFFLMLGIGLKDHHAELETSLPRRLGSFSFEGIVAISELSSQLVSLLL